MIFDLCIIGGGINGVGIARDAAGRGLKVLLLEKGDLAGATSSASSKMIHGGLRYLEFYEFSLVRKSLAEREVLLKIAPDIVRPIRFCIPQNFATRPAWLIRLGLFLYDHLSWGMTLPHSECVKLANHPFGSGLHEGCNTGFLYSDCWVDDARLVVLNAMDARNYGAVIKTYEPCTALKVVDGEWIVSTHKEHYRARVVVNATGPYAEQFLLDMGCKQEASPKLRLVQGSHIIVKKLYDGDQCYMLQQPDGRVVFIWPYEDKYTMIGTTETAYEGDPIKAHLTSDELNYLIKCAGHFFRKPILKGDVIWSFSGVRPLFEDHQQDAKKVTRDYRFHVDQSSGATLLSIYGGKLTTYRLLAEEVMNLLRSDFLSMGKKWTDCKVLPHIPNNLRYRPDGITDEIIKYFIEEEYAQTPEDILWRRTKWGLHMSQSERQGFVDHFKHVYGALKGK